MAWEIERKFLLRGDRWRQLVRDSQRLVQGYLLLERRSSIRVRLAGEQALLNIKGATLGVRRREYEYSIPLADAQEMLAELCQGAPIEKIRHYVPFGRHLWEIDEFFGANAGLIVAEIELADPDEDFERPPWLGREVSDDPRFYNVRLVEHPYQTWSIEERR